MSNSVADPFWHGGAAALLLTVLALGMFRYVYEPARDAQTALIRELKTAELRQTEKKARLQAMRAKCAELESGDPETVTEVIRQELLKGAADEYFK